MTKTNAELKLERSTQLLSLAHGALVGIMEVWGHHMMPESQRARNRLIDRIWSFLHEDSIED